MSEAEFTDTVVDYAKLRGWQVAHFRPARTREGWRTAMQGHKGFPDLCFARKGIVLFAELKVGGNQMTPEQETWATHIGKTHYLWRPTDWPTIQQVLA